MTNGQEMALGLIFAVLGIRWLANGRIQNIVGAAFNATPQASGPTDPFSQNTGIGANPFAPVSVDAGGMQAYDPFSSLSLAGTTLDDGVTFVPSGIVNFTSNGHLGQYKIPTQYLPSFQFSNADPASNPDIPSTYILDHVAPHLPSPFLIDGYNHAGGAYTNAGPWTARTGLKIPGTLPTRVS